MSRRFDAVLRLIAGIAAIATRDTRSPPTEPWWSSACCLQSVNRATDLDRDCTDADTEVPDPTHSHAAMTVERRVLRGTYALRLMVGGRPPRRWKQALSLQQSAFGIVAVLQRNGVQRHRIAVAPAGAGNGDERAGAGTVLDPGRQRGLDIAPGVRDSHQDVVIVSGCQHVEPALRWTRSLCLARAASTFGHAASRAGGREFSERAACKWAAGLP